MNKFKLNNMNAKKLIVLGVFGLMVLTFSSFKSQDKGGKTIKIVEYQNGLIVYATYMGMDGDGYAFEKKAKNGKTLSIVGIGPYNISVLLSIGSVKSLDPLAIDIELDM